MDSLFDHFSRKDMHVTNFPVIRI